MVLKFQEVPAIYQVFMIGAPPVFLNRLIALSSLLLFWLAYCCCCWRTEVFTVVDGSIIDEFK